MRGFGCNCPSCGAPERVSLFVLDSAAVRFSHRCAHCGEASALAAWSVPPLHKETPKATTAGWADRGIHMTHRVSIVRQ